MVAQVETRRKAWSKKAALAREPQWSEYQNARILAMNHAELANNLNKCEYPLIVTGDFENRITSNGLVVLHPCSLNSTEVDGAIRDEFGLWGGGTVYLNRLGLVLNIGEDGHEIEEPIETVDDVLRLSAAIKSSIRIKVIDSDENPLLRYEMPENFPHSNFEMHDGDGNVMAICVVFSVNDMPQMVEA